MKRPAWVLIVDDDNRWRRTLRTVFDDMGFHIVEAQTEREALDAISSRYFDLIMVDLRLASGCSGLDIIKKVKDLNLKTGAMVVVTGYADSKTAITALELGADFFQKGRMVLGELRSRAREVLSDQLEEPHT